MRPACPNPAVSWAVVRHLFLAVLAMLAVASGSGSAQATCDRQWLTDTLTRYLNAMVAHDPAAVPLAASVGFTENTAPLKVGEGLWKSEIKFPSYVGSWDFCYPIPTCTR